MYTAAQAAAQQLPRALLPSPDPLSAAAALPGAVRHVYVTSVGDAPRVLPAGESLADPLGLPISLAVSAGPGDEFDRAL
jgi:hypothetical protein